MRLTNKLCLLVLVVFWCGPNINAEPIDAIVTIWVNVGGGTKSFGTGFFISSDGQIATAYHVVQDAKHIRVNHQGTAYNSIIVDRIAPNLDLAILRVNQLPEPVPFLQLASGLPPGVANEYLVALGHAAGIRDQRFQGRMTRSGYVLSQEIRGKRSERLFALDNVQLISLDLNIHNGLSGGPVLSTKGVLGVVSGSLAEGGSIAWAIPSDHLFSDSMQPVNRPASSISTWPKLSLMGPNWRNLRKRVAISSELARSLDDFFASVDRLAAAQENVQIQFVKARPLLMLLRAELEKLSSGRPNMLFKDVASIMFDVYMEDFGAHGEAQYAASNEMVTSATNAAQALVAIFDRIGDIPVTQKNLPVIMQMEELLSEGITQMDDANQYLEGLDKEAAKILSEMNLSPQYTVQDFLLFLDRLDGMTKLQLSPTTTSHYQARVRSLRQYGKVFDIFITEDLDEPDQNWLFASDAGYRLTVPAGLEIVRMKPAFRAGMEADFRALDYRCEFEVSLFNRQGITNIGASTPLMILNIGVIHDRTTVSDLLIESSRRSMNVLFHSVGVEKRTIGGRQVLVATGKYRQPVRGYEATRHFAMVPFANKTLVLFFELPSQYASEQWPTFHFILENLEVMPQ